MDTDLQNKLLSLARQTLENELRGAGHDTREFDIKPFHLPGGVFVTLTSKGELRGCIGRIESDELIYRNVIELSKSAAFEDHRFSPVTEKELDEITIEISLLTVPEAVEGITTIEKIDQIRPGRDGVVLAAEGKRATFLPQVWDSLPVKEEFISELCRKAGLSRRYWQDHDMSVLRYQVEEFEEVNPQSNQ